jgi:hypothetical protein
MRDQPFGLKDMFFSQRIMKDFAKKSVLPCEKQRRKKIKTP